MKDLRSGRHCVFLIHAHLVFITKYRGKILDDNTLDYMEDVMRQVAAQFEAELIEFNGEKDHVHLLINYPPKVCLAKLINSLKGVSSRLIRQKFPNIKCYSSGKKSKALWSPSYFAGSIGGASLDVVKRYIENQNRPHDI